MAGKNSQKTNIKDSSQSAQDEAIILGAKAALSLEQTTNTTETNNISDSSDRSTNYTDNSSFSDTSDRSTNFEDNSSTVTNYTVSDAGSIAAAFDFGATANAQAASTVKSSLDLLGQANNAAAALASQSVASNVSFLDTALKAGQSAQAEQSRQNMEFLESTRSGNQAAAADLAAKALDLAEKRTGTEQDQTNGLISKLTLPALIIGGIFLLLRRSSK